MHNFLFVCLFVCLLVYSFSSMSKYLNSIHAYVFLVQIVEKHLS